jgi:hypothetical protein
MKILIRVNQGEKWGHLNHTEYSGEAHLQNILYNDPDVIPLEDVYADGESVPIKLMLKEVGLEGSGSVDLLGVDEIGNIFIIETKLAKNPEAKREVIGQVLEYAAFLQGKEVDWLDEITKKKKQLTIAQHFEGEPNWDRESFMQRLHDNLKSGTFKLFIVVDETNVALQKTINRMKERGEEIYALELRYFNKNGTEILVPSVHTGRKQAEGKPRIYWTKEKFFEEAEKHIPDEQTRQTLMQLFEFSNQFSNQIGGKVDFGSGRTIGTFSLRFPYKDASEKLYVISYVRQFTWFTFNEMVQHGIDKTIISSYIKELNQLEFQLGEDVNRDPTFDLAILNDKNKFEKFKNCTMEFRDKLLNRP